VQINFNHLVSASCVFGCVASVAISALVIRLFYCHVYKWTTDPYHNMPFPPQEL
jgi:hypothetical protein